MDNPPANHSTTRVLVVEDDSGYAELVVRRLTRFGFEVTIAPTLQAARAELDRVFDSIDCLVVDLSLPDAIELEAIDTLTALATSLPLIAHSVTENRDTAMAAIRLGAQDFVRKGEDRGERLARAILFAVERKGFEAELIARAHRDHLTGLANRGLFDDSLARGIASARRHGRELTIAFADVDNFKRINDVHGHSVGDLVLCEIARRLLASVRTTDLVARFGGDEFVVLCVDAAGSGTTEPLKSRLEKALAAPFEHPDGEPLRVTVSLGVVSSAPTDHDNLSAETILGQADQLMYDAKQSRRRFQARRHEQEATEPSVARRKG